jgi:hypothetical protein
MREFHHWSKLDWRSSKQSLSLCSVTWYDKGDIVCGYGADVGMVMGVVSLE